MNAIFDFKRFVTFFKYDLFSARARFGQSLIISSLTPIWVFICYEAASLLAGKGWSQMDSGMQITALILALILLMISGPIKLYGFLTNKKSGSSWLMIPASTFEKFLSMILIVCILLPAIGFTLVFGSDALMSLLPGYPEPLLASGSSVKEAADLGDLKEVLNPLTFWGSWCENALAFTLGAACFRKAKAGKTILCIMGFTIIAMSLTMLFFQSPNINSEQLFDFFGGDSERAIQAIKAAVTAIYLVVIGGLCCGLFFRLKTIKH